eukprot:g33628.t1
MLQLLTDGLGALCFFLEQRPEPFPPTATILRLAELVLTLNNFCFNSSHFLQVRDVAMDTRMGTSYACLFVGLATNIYYKPTDSHSYLDCTSSDPASSSTSRRSSDAIAATSSKIPPLRHIFPSRPLSTFRRDRSLWGTLVDSSFNPNTTCPLALSPATAK